MTYGKSDPGVPVDAAEIRAEISRRQEAMGLPPLAPATDTTDNERPPPPPATPPIPEHCPVCGRPRIYACARL